MVNAMLHALCSMLLHGHETRLPAPPSVGTGAGSQGHFLL